MYRISFKIGYHSDTPGWTDVLYLCYPLFTLYHGIPYAILVTISLITIECLLIIRRNDVTDIGFSKRMTTLSLWITWFSCLAWSAMELYVIGNGIEMRKKHTKQTCYLADHTTRIVVTISFLGVTIFLATFIIVATVILVAFLIRNPEMRSRFYPVATANTTFVMALLPFLVTNTCWHLIPGSVPKFLWYDLYFLMKSAYLLIPLMWLVHPSDITHFYRQCRNQCRAESPPESRNTKYDGSITEETQRMQAGQIPICQALTRTNHVPGYHKLHYEGLCCWSS